MPNTHILSYFSRYLPDTLSKVTLVDVSLDIQSSSPILSTIRSFPLGFFFLVTGETWMIHPLRRFSGSYDSFLLPLCYRYCADFQFIACLRSQYDQYPKELLQLYKTYGYGVFVLSPDTDQVVTLLDYPLAQHVLLEIRQQLQNYVHKTFTLPTSPRSPFWTWHED